MITQKYALYSLLLWGAATAGFVYRGMFLL